MKKVFLCLLTALSLFMLVACTKNKETFEIGFVTDIGQLLDKSFNQGTWEGIEKYAKEHDKTYNYYQPANADKATDDDRYNAMKAAVDNGAKIVVCAGFMQEVALKKAAEEFKDVKFVFVDGWNMGLENITAIVFQEEQAGYFAGYAAVMEGYTKLGFTGGGGGTNPACQRFGYGYIQGANDAAKSKNITVAMKYSWAYGTTFSASADLQTMLEGWYTTGTEVIFACGGSMCQSAFAAAGANNKKVIGVDVDQSGDSQTVITSATKGLANGTIYALEKYFDGKWAEISDKTITLGVANDAVGLPTATWSLTNFTLAQYNELYAKVKAGTVVVDGVIPAADSETPLPEKRTYSNVTLEFIE